MTKLTQPWTMQLKEACKAGNVRWAAWLARAGGGWEIGVAHGLNKSHQAALRECLQDAQVAAWLAGALSSGRVRWREVAQTYAALGCRRLYLFPNPSAHALLLVAAQSLDKNAEIVFRALSHVAPQAGYPETPLEEQVPQWLLETTLETTFDADEIFKNILDFLADTLRCDAAYLAVRFGDIFRIQAVRHCPPVFKGRDIPLQAEASFARLIATRQGVILDEADLDPHTALHEAFSPPPRNWLGVPIVIGQRVIGLVGFLAYHPGVFSPTDAKRIAHHLSRLAYAIENAIVFAEAARYLQQLALLNELASAVSTGVDIAEVSQRLTQRLGRTFGAGRVSVFLLAADGKSLRAYGSETPRTPLPTESVEARLAETVIANGQPLRFDSPASLSEAASGLGPRSGLAVPLKYRGQLIGAITLESAESNAFTAQDEQLLGVIASNLAGLIENVRLHEETRQRARTLQDTVRQLQAARETALDISGDLDLDTLIQRTVHRARELVGARGAELGLLDAAAGLIRIQYAETPWNFRSGEVIPLLAGVAGWVAAFGEPLVVADYNNWKGRLFPDRRAPFRSVAGVPLRFGGEIVGTLTVMDDRPDKNFHDEDVRLLELLAPQIAVSIRNARLYQELQERIEAQRLAENRLLLSARLAAVGEMAAGVAHELNNPLTTVTGFVELALEETPPDSSLREDLTLVLQEAQRARRVVRRLLDFARPAESQRCRTDLNHLIHETIELVNHLIRTHGVTLYLELDDNLSWVQVDPNQIKQVLLNLIHNALQAMPDGGELRIGSHLSYQDSRRWAAIVVADSGEGIPPENLNRIFEPFFTTRPIGYGTGLGLSITYGIITDHGGYIDVESQLGQGSRFTVYLPVDDGDADA